VSFSCFALANTFPVSRVRQFGAHPQPVGKRRNGSGPTVVRLQRARGAARHSCASGVTSPSRLLKIKMLRRKSQKKLKIFPSRDLYGERPYFGSVEVVLSENWCMNPQSKVCIPSSLSAETLQTKFPASPFRY